MQLSKRARRRCMVLGGIVMIAGMAAVGFRGVSALQQGRLVAEAREEGLAAFERGDLESALTQLSYFVQHHKDDPDAIETLLTFADTRSRIPRPNGEHLFESAGLYQHARSLVQSNPKLENRASLTDRIDLQLLDLYDRLGMKAEMLDTAERLLARDEGSIPALSGRAKALYRSRRFNEALDAIRIVINADPDENGWKYLELRILRDLKQTPEQQLDRLNEWIAQRPNDTGLQILKAGWLAEIGRIDQARSTAELAMMRDSRSLEELQQLVGLLDILDMPEHASKVLSQARSAFPNEQWVLETIIKRKWRNGQVMAAIEDLHAAENQFDRLSSELLKLKALLLLSSDRVDEIEPVLDLLAHDKSNGNEKARVNALWADALRARLKLEEANWQSTIDAYRSALALQPDDAVIHFFLGEAYAAVDEHALAIDAMQRARMLAPGWQAAGAALAESLLAARRPLEAFELCRSIAGRSAEGRMELYTLLARTYLAATQAGGSPVLVDGITGRTVSIIALLQMLREHAPENPELASLLVEAYAVTGQPAEARRVIQTILAAPSSGAEMLLPLARQSERFSLGVERELLDRAEQRSGNTLAVARAQSRRLARESRYDEGLARIDDAIAKLPVELRQSVLALELRADYLLQVTRAFEGDAAAQSKDSKRSDFKAAGVRTLRQLIELHPRSIRAQAFALAQPLTWRDAPLTRKVIDQLAALVGKHTPQVAVAEARYLLNFKGEEESERAKAIVMINAVLEQAPDSLPALVLMAQASLGGAHPSYDRAVAHLERAIETAPARRDLYLNLIALLQRQGNFETAGQYLTRLSRLPADDPDSARNELFLLNAQGDVRAALNRAGALVSRASEVTDMLVLASLQLRAGEIAKAERIYLELLDRTNGANDDPLVIAQAAEFFAVTGRMEEGVALLARSTAEEKPLLLGAFYLRHGMLEEAQRWLNEAGEKMPDSADVRLNRARLALASGKPGRALEEAIVGLRKHPESASLRAICASASLSATGGDVNRTIATLAELSPGGSHKGAGSSRAADDALMALLKLLAELPTDARQPTEAELSDVRRLVEQWPAFLPAWRLAIVLHHAAGRSRDAVEFARRAVSRFPVQPEPAEWAARMLMEYGQWHEALTEAQEWRRRTLGDPLAADIAIAHIKIAQRRPRDAAEQLAPHRTRLIERRAASPDHLGLLLLALAQSDRVEVAWSIIEPLLEEHGRWPAIWTGLTQRVDAEVAANMLTLYEGRFRDPDPLEELAFAQAWASLGSRFDRSDWLERAEVLTRSIVVDDDMRPMQRFALGRIAEARGNLAEAERLYRATLTAKPGDAAALNNLAFVLAQDASRGDEALRLINQALKEHADHPDLLDTKATVLIALGKSKEAKRVIDRAIALRPTDIGLNLSLARALIESESFDRAASVLQSVRERLDALEAPNPSLKRKFSAIADRLEQKQVAAGSEQ